MNVHHLELFYHVAKHRGVSAAARHMPYGIQQPAISAQILQLEDTLGVTLFHRRPFKLTRQGEELFQFIAPFFGGIEEMAGRLRGGVETRLRIAAPEIVQRDYLSELLSRMRKRVPGFQFTLHPGRVEDIEKLLHAQEIDVGLATLASRKMEEIKVRKLLDLKMVLLAHKSSGIRHARDIFNRDRIEVPLITLPEEEPVCRVFKEVLRKRKVDWFPALVLSSLDIIRRYVADGFGVGLSLAAPRDPPDDRIRVLPLDDFPQIEFGAMWMGRLSATAELFLDEASQTLKDMGY